MTTLLLDCSHGSLKHSFADAIISLLPDDVLGNMKVRIHLAEPDHDDRHHHHSVADVEDIISQMGLSKKAEEAALGVYGILAKAEAKAHGTSVDKIHFHEVGSLNAITCVCAACEAMVELSPNSVMATPICTGFGFVDCAHGRLPIPAPATANILEGLPTFTGNLKGEKTTPTGAALVKYFAEGFAEPELIQPTWTAMVGAL